ncbi:MAG: hypothetical protein AB7S41_08920 [Parvibaculaceae bacterium]
MKTKTEMLINFDHNTAGEVRLAFYDDDHFVIEQDNDKVILPKSEVAEFCRVLSEWAAANG